MLFMKHLLFFTCMVIAAFSQETNVEPVPPPSKELSSPPALKTPSFWEHHHNASIGYRRDRQLFEEPFSKTEISGRNSLQLILGSHIEFHEIVFHLRGSYGWLINGDLGYSAASNIFSEPLSFPTFDLGAGYSADALGAIGFRIKLYTGPVFRLSLVPSGGYRYGHMMNFAKGEKRYTVPNPPNLLSPGTSGFALNTNPIPNQQDWFGPYAEGRLELHFWQNLEWNLFFSYLWPSFRSKSEGLVNLYLFNPATNATAVELYRVSSVYSGNYINKMLAGTDMKYHTDSGWTFGLHFEGSSAWTHKGTYKAKIAKEQYILAPVGQSLTQFEEIAQAFWVSYEASISLGFQF